MSPKRSVRIQQSDAAAVSVFLLSQPEETQRFFHPFPFDVDSVRSALANPAVVIYGIERDGVMVGIWLLLHADSELPELGVMIDVEHQRQGYGSFAIETAKTSVRHLGKRGLRLVVYADNKSARSLYTKTGFEAKGLAPDGQIRMEWNA